MKPKYSIKNNFLYAIDGLKELYKEKAFKIELVFFFLFSIVLFFLPYPLWSKIFLFASLFLPLFAEAFNTSIEKVVDLVSDDYHILAKHAKDIAAFGVAISIMITFLIWVGFVVYFY
ncbi:MAG: diacylglycerol kinase [Arcobacteraceae bacterium]|nr:diacylglycerol kinase [Arcobacteraceae bacterium]